MKTDFLALYRDDFVRWANDCVRIYDKASGRTVPLTLNRPQRRVVDELERMRREGRPIRLLLLKARQWGGSTLIQAYILWMQLVRHTGKNSILCAHVKDAAAAIRGIASKIIREYPDALKHGGRKLWLPVPYEKSSASLYLPARDCVMSIATANSPHALRGMNFHLAHLSEVAFWGDGDDDLAEQIVRTVAGSVPAQPESIVVMESTANVRNSLFYREWRRAVEGRSDKTPVFDPWFEIELYRTPPLDEQTRMEVIARMDDYERWLSSSLGVDMEAIAWYQIKRREYPSHEAMMAEFPSTADEAFGALKGDLRGVPLPLVEDAPGNPEMLKAPSLAVVTVDSEDRPSLLSLFIRRDDRLLAVADRPLDGSLKSRLMSAADMAAAYNSDIMIACAAGDTRQAGAAWMADEAIRLGLPLIYDDAESPLAIFSGHTISAALTLLREALRAGRLAETAAEALDAYRQFSADSPWRHPALMARMCALQALRNGALQHPDIRALLRAQQRLRTSRLEIAL